MDAYCEDCALNRCDCYPDVCPVKYPQDRGSAATASPGDKEIASRLWGILMGRLTPLQIRTLHRIHLAHPTTSELAMALDVTPQHAGNLASSLYREGFVRREQAGGRQYRWFPAFRAPLPFHYFDKTATPLTGEAAQRAEEILRRRGKL